ncbi:MAG: hypothetical protein J6O50_13555 [Ruminiclostridium sp.]|nr:hypothetical protein [Ruminiclostridium sp.]
MNGKYLLDKMDLIDPAFIENADKKPRKKPIKWQQWTALAACLVLSVTTAVMMAVNPAEEAGIAVTGPDTASLFSEGGLLMILLAASLLAALAIAALIIKNKKE